MRQASSPSIERDVRLHSPLSRVASTTMTSIPIGDLSLFEVSVQVDATGRVSPYFSQATVTAAVWASSQQLAISSLNADLIQSVYIVLAGHAHTTEIPVAAWDSYIQATWPAQVGNAPSQADMQSGKFNGLIVQLGFYPHE